MYCVVPGTRTVCVMSERHDTNPRIRYTLKLYVRKLPMYIMRVPVHTEVSVPGT